MNSYGKRQSKRHPDDTRRPARFARSGALRIEILENRCLLSVSLASPTLATTPVPTAVTLGNTSTTLTDTAVLAGGYDPAGTITFTLYNPSGTLVDTETGAVSGDGTYSTPTGYTLPSTGTVTGVYQWDANYSGDGNNNPVGGLVTLGSFNGVTNGANPVAGLIEDSAGNLFGTTQGGGMDSYGTVFEVPAGTSTITTLAWFDATDGYGPTGGLIEDSAGNLFGTTAGGGPDDGGTVFEVLAGTNTITDLAWFNGVNGTDGAYPEAGLIEDSQGDLFGTTNEGGANGVGTVFEVAAGSNAVTTLASFNGSNGAYPYTGLIEDSQGNLFGTTAFGGVNNDGTVFEVAAGTNTITDLAAFNGSNGSVPYAGLVEDVAGDFFGTAASGGTYYSGTVFEVLAGTNTITDLASFNVNDGNVPWGGLVEDSAGNLFGTANQGGASRAGTVFEVAAGSGTITTLASFNGSNGDFPYTGLIEDSQGNLFGTTYDGGAGGWGTVFELTAPPPPDNVTVSAATPTLAATPVPTAATLGNTSTTLTDTAVVAGGYNPTGTITFALYNPSGTLVDTANATVSGDGTYSTPTGYTLPGNGVVTGTYQWDAAIAATAITIRPATSTTPPRR